MKKNVVITIKQKILIFLAIMLSASFYIMFFVSDSFANEIYLADRTNYLKEICETISSQPLFQNSFKDLENFENQNVLFSIIDKTNGNIVYSSKGVKKTINLEDARLLSQSSTSLVLLPETDENLNKILLNISPAKNQLSYMYSASNCYILAQSSYVDFLYSSRFFKILLIFALLCAVLVCLFASAFFSFQLTKPLKQLYSVVKKIEQRNFSSRCNIKTHDEIAKIGAAVNSMADSLEDYTNHIVLTNNRLKKDIKKKTQIEESQKSFISNMSHEIKTPISIISGYAEALQAGLADDEKTRDEYCQIIIDECIRISSLTKQLLSLARAENKDTKLNYSNFSINELCDSLINIFSLKCSNNNITIKKEYYCDKTVCADMEEIEKVLMNYLQNAIKHTPNNGTITVTIKPERSSTYISVHNTGSHIDDEDIKHIWDKFYKVDKSHKRDEDSTGLGLSIVKAIMNLHNKPFGVKNTPSGVEFFIIL